MHPARIAELLAPFLDVSSIAAVFPEPCHSERDSSREESALLSPSQLQHISTYIDILLRWNARINLTAIRDPEEIVTRHFGESLFAARHLFPQRNHVGTAAQACPERSRRGCPAEQSSASAMATNAAAERRQNAAHSLPRAGRGGVSRGSLPPGTQAPEGRKNYPSYRKHDVQAADSSADHKSSPETNDQQLATNDRTTLADLGSGAGFPGLPIKLWAPQISLTLIESNHKKSTFLREVTRALTLTHVDIQTTRAQTLKQTFDVVTLRAVERFADILPTAASLVAPTGRLALLISTNQLEQAQATLPSLTWHPPILIPKSQSRILRIGASQPKA